MTATIEQVSELLGSRLTELFDERDRIDDEKCRIEKAVETLSSSPNGPKPAPVGRPKKRRPHGDGPGGGGGPGRGHRATQAIELIKAEAGITAAEIAKKLKIKPNYLYRVLGDLAKEGLVKKDGRSYFPAD